ncbi:MAG: alpha/beta hydrolase [Planctomycetes bacterium]|nr:alpha/beta hydrolase [Planctomycetota bacterium]
MKKQSTIQRYKQEISELKKQLLAGSEVVETASGPIEVAIEGAGQPVLSIHGGLGGYDQGLLAARTMIGEGYKIIAPSRFGYLRTPMPKDSSPAAMADSLADLLDALDIPPVMVLASSSGGPSAIQFAIRHPGRVSALVLNVCVVHAYEGISTAARINNSIGWRSDFLFWYVVDKLGDKIGAQYGITEEYVKSQPQEEQDYLRGIWRLSNPVSQRRLGMLNDLIPRANDYPIERISAPTLIVHAVDDTVNNFSHAEYAAAKIQGSQLFKLESGGHLKLGQRDRVKKKVRQFLPKLG